MYIISACLGKLHSLCVLLHDRSYNNIFIDKHIDIDI